MHVVHLYIITNCKLLDALEKNNKELFLKEELPPQASSLEWTGSNSKLQENFRSIEKNLQNISQFNEEKLKYVSQ